MTPEILGELLPQKILPKSSEMAGCFIFSKVSPFAETCQVQYLKESDSKSFSVMNPARNRNLVAVCEKQQGAGTGGAKWSTRSVQRHKVSEVLG